MLDQILSCMLVLEVLPTADRIAEFLGAAFGDLPGVKSCEVRLGKAGFRHDAPDEAPSATRWVIPVATGSETYGAMVLQTADERALAPYRPFIGNLASYVAVLAENRARQERLEEALEQLHESEQRYRALFEQMMEGFAYCRLLFDDQGRPVDLTYLAVNRAFEVLTKLTDVVGKRASEAIPGFAEQPPELLETYARVSSTGEPERFEIYFTPLSKWLDIAVSSPAKDYFVAVFTDISDRKRAEEQLRELSLRDELTGLYNRRAFMELAAAQLRVARRNGKGMLLMYADLDGMKRINDELGHTIGDQALSDAAETLRAVFRDSDVLARIGGDEFVVLATEADAEAEASIPGRLEQAVAERNGSVRRPFRLNLSYGIVAVDPGADLSLDDLMHQADRLMYQAKRRDAGRDPLHRAGQDDHRGV